MIDKKQLFAFSTAHQTMISTVMLHQNDIDRGTIYMKYSSQVIFNMAEYVEYCWRDFWHSVVDYEELDNIAYWSTRFGLYLAQEYENEFDAEGNQDINDLKLPSVHCVANIAHEIVDLELCHAYNQKRNEDGEHA